MSQITLCNATNYPAQFVFKKGDQVIARLPGIAPGATMQIPTTITVEVVASTVLDGNTYTSAPLSTGSSASFLARVIQAHAQGTYVFDVQTGPGTAPNQLSFQKTCLNPVTFAISLNGRPLQTVAVNDSFFKQTLDIGDTYSVYAVVNGVATDPVQTTNPNATVTVVVDSTDLASGYFTLRVS